MTLKELREKRSEGREESPKQRLYRMRRQLDSWMRHKKVKANRKGRGTA